MQGSPGGPSGKEMQEMRVWSLCWEDSLEKGMATHSSILAWQIPRGAWWATVHGVAESDMTEHAPLDYADSIVLKKNNNPGNTPCPCERLLGVGMVLILLEHDGL